MVKTISRYRAPAYLCAGLFAVLIFPALAGAEDTRTSMGITGCYRATFSAPACITNSVRVQVK